MRAMQRSATVLLWLVVLFFAAVAARYFLSPPPLITAPNLNLLVQHRFLFLGHIGAGIVAAVAGLFQFSAALRRRRPVLHRNLGKAYVLFVLFSGMLAVALGPRMFRAFAMPSVVRGLSPMLAISGIGATQLFPAFLGFEALAAVWITFTALAFVRARQRRFDEHRAWMVRSYSLTFAFVTVRFLAGPLLLLTHNAALALALSIWSWTLNLVVAEWIVRAAPPESHPIRLAARA